MNDEKKKKNPIQDVIGKLSDELEERGPVEAEFTADELVVIDLHNQIRELNEREIHLEYQLSGASDVLRMNTAARIMSVMVGNKLIRTDTDKDAAIATAVDFADRLATHYQQIIEKAAVEYQKRVAAMDQEDDGDDDTVQ